MAPGPRQPSSHFLRCVPSIRIALGTQAVHCALAGLALGAAAAATPLPASAQSAAQGRTVDFTIAAGTLDEVLGRFGQAAAITVAADPRLTRGLSSQGLSGRYSVAEGLARLLSGTGLEAIPNANGEGYRLQRSPQAANPAGPVTLPTVLVSGRELDATSEGTGSYAARAVTMFGKTPAALKDIPSSVSVLTRQQMDDQNIRSIQDAMQRATGITSVDYGDGTGYFNARGFPVNVQFDGISIANGIQYQPQFDMAMYDRIEIFRGPSGLMDGQGSLGGSVNLVRKAPSDQFHVISETSMGSWADYRQMIDVTGPLNKEGTLRGRVVGVGAKSNSFTDGENSKEGMGYGIIEYDPNPNTTVSLSVGYQSFPLDKFDYGIGLDEGDNLVQGPRGRSQNYGADWNHSYMSLQEANGSIKHRMDNGWKTEGTVFYRRYYSSGKYAYANPPAAGSNIADYSGQSQRLTDHWFGIDANISGPITLFGRQHDILLGANYSSFKQESLSGFQDLGDYDIFKPAIPDPSIPYDFGTDQRTEQYGVYGQARLRVADPLSVVLGGRELYFRQQTRGTLPTEEDWTTASRENGKFVPYGGIIYDLNKQVSAYTSYTKIFSAQSATTFDGGALPPLSGEQYEVGLKGSFFDKRLNASVAAFRIDGDDLAVQDADHPTGSVASGKVRSQGWEAEVSGMPLPNWNVTAGYTLLNTKYLSSPTQEGQAFDTEEPRHLFKLWTNYRFTQGALQGASLGGGMLLQSNTSRSAVPQAGYAVFGLKAGYQFNSHLEAIVAVNNLFDRRYYDRAPGFYYSQYGTPRSVMLTVRATY